MGLPLFPIGLWGASSTLPNGRIAYWKQDEAGGVGLDSGPNALTLTDNNTVEAAAGKVGGARHYTAAVNESLSIADNAAFSAITTAMTISLWAYPDTLGTAALLSKWTYQTDGEWVAEMLGAIPRLFIAGNATDVGLIRSSGPSLAVAGSWLHLIWIFDGTLTGDDNRLKLYANGTLQTLTHLAAIPASIRNGTAPLRIGAWSGSLTRYWNGRMDNVQIWNRALAPAEIAEEYNNGLAGRES